MTRHQTATRLFPAPVARHLTVVIPGTDRGDGFPVTVSRRTARAYSHVVVGLWDWTRYPDDRARQGQEWRAASWHHSFDLACTGLEKARLEPGTRYPVGVWSDLHVLSCDPRAREET